MRNWINLKSIGVNFFKISLLWLSFSPIGTSSSGIFGNLRIISFNFLLSTLSDFSISAVFFLSQLPYSPIQ